MQLPVATPMDAGVVDGMLGIAPSGSPAVSATLFESLLQGVTASAAQSPVVASPIPGAASLLGTPQQPAAQGPLVSECDGSALCDFLQCIEQYLDEAQLSAVPDVQAQALTDALQQVDAGAVLGELVLLQGTGAAGIDAMPATNDALAERIVTLLARLGSVPSNVAPDGEQAAGAVAGQPLPQVLQQMLQVLTAAGAQAALPGTQSLPVSAATLLPGEAAPSGGATMRADGMPAAPINALQATGSESGVSARSIALHFATFENLASTPSMPLQRAVQAPGGMPQAFSNVGDAALQAAVVDEAAAPVVTTAVADGIARLAALLASYAPHSTGTAQPTMRVGVGTTALSDTAHQLMGDLQHDTSLLHGRAQQLLQTAAMSPRMASDVVVGGEGGDPEPAADTRSLPAESRSLPAQPHAPLSGDGASAAEVSAAAPRAAASAGTPGQSATTLSTSVPTDALVEKLAATMNASLQQRTRSVTIQMDPPELGKVSVEMVVRNNQLRAVIVAESDAVKQVLEANIEQLRDNLELQQISVDRLSVMVGQEGRQFASLLRDQAGQQRAGRAPLKATARTAVQQDAPVVRRISDGTVDMFA